MNIRKVVGSLFFIAICVHAGLMSAQKMSDLDRDRAQDMLKAVADDIRKHYYDPKLHGVDWDARVARAKQEIDKAPSIGMTYSHIAAAIDSLNDSHTNFFPPDPGFRYAYGWHQQMIGDRCFVTRVRPKSDAEKQGIKPGDEILTINGYLPDRKSLRKMEYVFHVLRPQSSLRLLMQLPADGSRRELDVNAKVTLIKRRTDLSWSWIREMDEEKHLMRARHVEIGDDLMILKLPYFAMENVEVASLMGKARKHRALILDLRGNPGGYEETLKWFVGHLFEKDIKIGDRIMREKTEPIKAKAQPTTFTSKLIVLVDSESSSASELLARVVQIEKRGVVLGDSTAGSVMASKFYWHQMGGSLVLFYGALVSEADLVMTDGKSLEHVGVTPDETVLPMAADLANGRDPVLARAAEMAGVKLTPEAAGKMFPYEWPSE